MKARLHTLEHFCDNSDLVLSTKQIKRLWACLGPRPRAVGHGDGSTGGRGGEVSTLLSWLSKACEACHGEGGGGMFEPDVAAELFEVRPTYITGLGLGFVLALQINIIE